jgi:hypothetical protein
MRPWEIKLLEECDEEQGVAREQYWYDTLMPLYNKQRPGQMKQEYQSEYLKSDKGKESRREINRRYRAKKNVLTGIASYAEQT